MHNKEYEEIIANKDDIISLLKDEITALRNGISNLESSISNFSVNWSAITPITIERNCGQTIIAYEDRNHIYHETHFNTSIDAHKELVKQFRLAVNESLYRPL